MASYEKIIRSTLADGGLLDALLALQKAEGYVSEDALTALAATILPPLVTLSVISCAYDWFATNPYVRYALKGMQCGATALIVNVAIDLLQKQWRKKLLWPLAIIVGTFVANFFFDVNIMLLVVIDGLLGLVFLRGAAYGK